MRIVSGIVAAACLALPIGAWSNEARTLDGCPATEAAARALLEAMPSVPVAGYSSSKQFDARGLKVMGFAPVRLLGWFTDGRVSEVEIYLPRKDHARVLAAFQKRYPGARCRDGDCEMNFGSDVPEGTLEDAGFYTSPSDEPGSRLACSY